MTAAGIVRVLRLLDALAGDLDRGVVVDPKPLLIAYSTAARIAGLDGDLVDRIWEAGADGYALARETAAEIRLITAAAQARFNPPLAPP